MGTPRYMAPEQCMGKDVGSRADIYSLGVILYEMYAGVPPFRGDTFGELLYQHMSMAPEPPSKHRPIDPALEQVILACLEKDPQRRPESAKDLSARLDHALGGGAPVTNAAVAIPPTAPPPSVAVPVASAGGSAPVTTMGQSVGEVSLPAIPRRTRPGLIVGAVALAVVVGGGALLLRARSTPTMNAVASPAPPPPALPPPAPATGSLRLHIENGPADRITLDGRVVGYGMSDVAVGDLAPGSHQVRLEGAYREPQAAAVTIEPGAAASLTLSLPPAVQPGSGLHRARLTTPAADDPTRPPAAGKPKVVKPSRAEEHGLMDANPFRNP
jgi:hypothetical protein